VITSGSPTKQFEICGSGTYFRGIWFPKSGGHVPGRHIARQRRADGNSRRGARRHHVVDSAAGRCRRPCGELLRELAPCFGAAAQCSGVCAGTWRRSRPVHGGSGALSYCVLLSLACVEAWLPPPASAAAPSRADSAVRGHRRCSAWVRSCYDGRYQPSGLPSRSEL